MKAIIATSDDGTFKIIRSNAPAQIINEIEISMNLFYLKTGVYSSTIKTENGDENYFLSDFQLLYEVEGENI